MNWPRDEEAPALAGGGASGTAEDGNLGGDSIPKRQVKGTGAPATKTRQLHAALMPLVERMHRGHYWRGTPDGPVCVKEPLDDFKLAQHCAGREAYGLCPIAPGGSTCRVALLDFDSHDGATDWPGMVRAARDVMDAAALLFGLKGVAFRSGGGRGVHVYFLFDFDQPQDAHSVREALKEVLAACDLKPGTAGVAAGEVEAYPKQDRVDVGGFGSMAILPLARKSVLLDDDGNPLPRDAVVSLSWPMSESVPFVAQVPKPERIITPSPDIDRLRSALAAIPNDADSSLSYDEWRNLGFAVHFATQGSDEGLEVFREWSARSPKHDDDFLENRFWGYAGVKLGGEVITERSLFALAERNGWQDLAIADDFDALPDAAEEAEGHDAVILTDLSLVRPKAIDWVWRDWLARGMLHILAGRPGTGKTTLALTAAATLTKGGTWPDRTPCQRGRVLIWSGEDDLDRVLVPRLIAMGADMTQVRAVTGMPGVRGRQRPFDPSKDMPALAQQLRKAGGADLLILDSIVSAVSGDSHKNTEVRRGLQPVVDLAQEFNCAVLGISHYTKGTDGRDPVERVSGSLAFGALARLVLASAKMPDNEGGGYLVVRAKSNIGPSGGGFRYQLLVEQLDIGVAATRVEWGESLDGGARDLLASAEGENSGQPSSAVKEACQFLERVLGSGPLNAEEVKRAARLESFSEATLRRAKKTLGVETHRIGGVGAMGVWNWALPGLAVFDEDAAQ